MKRGFKTPGSGRQKGTPNKTTIARQEAIVQEERASGRRLAIIRLAEIADHFGGLAAKYSPTRDRTKPFGADGKLDDTPPDEARSVGYLRESAKWLAEIAPYQSPKLQSTTLAQDKPLDVKPITVTVKFI